jgi:Tol biopolymer transport system component
MNTVRTRISAYRPSILCAAMEALVCLGVVLISACADERGLVEPGSTDAALLAIVSDPAETGSAAQSIDAAGAPSAASGSEVGYVSLAPGSLDQGTEVDVRNLASGFSELIPIVDGGFDPVAIPAAAGDMLDFVVRERSFVFQQWSVPVPTRDSPRIVRTDPPRGKRDVPVALSILVVFSEPMDSTTLDPATVRLLRDGAVVPGRVELTDDWIAQFTPSAPLAPGATYELAVTGEVSDLDGESLESALTVTFTTVDIPSAPLGGGELAFSRWDGSSHQMYTMRRDGSGLVALGGGIDPSFSPDGTKLAFWRGEEADSGDVYVMNADGTSVTQVTTSGYQPTWSPDGRRLAYGCGGICLINIDGTGQMRLTPAAPVSADRQTCMRDSDPSWSPNGSTIAFTRWPAAQIPTSGCLALSAALSFPFDFWTEIQLIDIDGTNLRPLRDAAGFTVSYAGWPAWSPDGTRLAFYFANGAFANGAEERIDVADADGLMLFTVVRRSPPEWGNVLGSPDWSPDGTQLVFSTADGWGFADATGSEATHLVTSPFGFLPYSLTWSWSRAVTP